MLSIDQFLAQTFPACPPLSPDALIQFSWRLGMKPEDISPEKCMVDQSNWQTAQIKRTGASLNCHHLLLQDTDEHYAAFTAAQAKQLKPYDQALSRAHFSSLCAERSGRDALYEDALQVATIVGAVTLSDAAKAQADKYLGANQWTPDSVEFTADTFDDIEKARQIYPLVEQLYQKHPSDHPRLSKLLRSAFAHKTHIRHMLYTECNANGFQAIADKIKQGQIDQESFDFCWDYWMDNIFGFRGNVAPQGSIYFTENTFKSTSALRQSLLALFNNPEATPNSVFQSYLFNRAQWLGLDNPDLSLNPREQMLLAHLGAMLRMFHPEQGEILAQGYKLMPKTLQKLSEYYFNVTDPTEPTPTYLPALFENAIDLRKKELEKSDALTILRIHQGLTVLKRKESEVKEIYAVIDVVAGFLPFYLAALKAYRDKRQSNPEFNQRLPLSFRLIASKDNIVKCFGDDPLKEGFNVLREFKPDVDDSGNLGFTIVKPRKSQSQKQRECEQVQQIFAPAYSDRYPLRGTRARQDAQVQPEAARRRGIKVQ